MSAIKPELYTAVLQRNLQDIIYARNLVLIQEYHPCTELYFFSSSGYYLLAYNIWHYGSRDHGYL